MKNGPVDPKEFGRYVALAQVGMEMVAPIGIGLALDRFLGWAPWALIAGATIGLVGGIGHLVALANRDHQNEDGSKPGPTSS